MLSKRLVAAAVACSALIVGASGCGQDKAPAAATASAPAATSSTSAGAAGHLDTGKLTAAEIEKQARDAMASLSSVKVAGNLVTDGQKMTLDPGLMRSQLSR
ncbi:hypothetical protein OG871_38195 [Kitasatospora sp. NBC_00374]|uniref:hypothetical protein n=1 Tax=Kitasatospora sp. NBC_00374 TaxID=2975964 RepID=UPI0030E568A5